MKTIILKCFYKNVKHSKRKKVIGHNPDDLETFPDDSDEE